MGVAHAFGGLLLRKPIYPALYDLLGEQRESGVCDILHVVFADPLVAGHRGRREHTVLAFDIAVHGVAHRHGGDGLLLLYEPSLESQGLGVGNDGVIVHHGDPLPIHHHLAAPGTRGQLHRGGVGQFLRHSTHPPYDGTDVRFIGLLKAGAAAPASLCSTTHCQSGSMIELTVYRY